MTRVTSADRTATVPRPRISERGAERREHILSVAVDHIGRLGFEGLRVRDVADEVGINNATLHHHYPSKKALIAGVVERFTIVFGAAQTVIVKGTAEQRLEIYVGRVRELMKTRPAMFVVLNELLVRANRDPEMAELIASSQEQWVAHVLELLTDAPLSPAEKHQMAERCRHELLGESLALSARGALSLRQGE